MTRRLTTIAILTSMSLTMFLLESMIPVPFLPPGAKLGLSNVIIVVALYILPSALDALMILSIRIFLSSMFAGSPMVILFALSGGLLSFATMFLLKKCGAFSTIGISSAGGFVHNLGQLAIAVVLTNGIRLINYLPILGICGILTGIMIGIVADGIIQRLKIM